MQGSRHETRATFCPPRQASVKQESRNQFECQPRVLDVLVRKLVLFKLQICVKIGMRGRYTVLLTEKKIIFWYKNTTQHLYPDFPRLPSKLIARDII